MYIDHPNKENSASSTNRFDTGRFSQQKTEADGPDKRITKQFLKNLLRSDIKLYYCTPNLNDTLYLHYKGFEAIENLEDFAELKVLYLDSNCIGKIENLSNKSKLRCLYLQENLIRKIQNLENLECLVTLNLSDNFISTIEGLDKNLELETLQLKRNKIGVDGLSDIEHLAKLKKLSSLDLSNNQIDCENCEDFLQILEGMTSLAVLYLQNNPICKKIPNYRKTLIARLKTLKYLDDRPVFPEERRYAEAFYFNGPDAEREERRKFKQEEENKHWQQHQAFREKFILPYQQPPTQQQANVITTSNSHERLDNISLNDSGLVVNNQSVGSSNLETYYTTEETDSNRNVRESADELDVSNDRKSIDDSLSVNELIEETKSLNLKTLEELD
jgi:dynein assembly factor 1